MNVYRGSEWNKWDLHVHTASSYDYKYKSDDADDLLCNELLKNDIHAVAITDHFLIDEARIRNLKSKAPGIVFFPGVELRTDKGANNLHVILIFHENSDLEVLSLDFDAIMRRNTAHFPDNDETIYWTFEEIVNFAKNHNALISVHAGRKTNGIDKEITNALPVQEVIKADIAKDIHFFEIGQKRDIVDYEKQVFKYIERKPLIICSDNHDPRNYSPKESLWIKADLTFEGLKQCLYQPLERVFIGEIPPIMDRLNKDKQSTIDSIVVKRIDKPRHDAAHWFDIKLPLNPGMTAIIGNKGAGKSALSDIIGHLCKCNTMENASFLNTTRFRKPPKNYADDYIARIQWADGEIRETSLAEENYATTIEDAQYLPQKYIEDVCNNIDNGFQEEIDKVIFSYVDRTERGEAQNLLELVQLKSHSVELNVQKDIEAIKRLNAQIIKLEKKQMVSYQKQVSDNLDKAQETLNRHDKSKPKEVKKPESKEVDTEYLDKLRELNDNIEQKQKCKDEINIKITNLNALINEAATIIAEIEDLESSFSPIKEMVDTFVGKYQLDREKAELSLTVPKGYFNSVKDRAFDDKQKYQEYIDNPDNGLTIAIQTLEKQKAELVTSADVEEKAYQKYLTNIDEWNKRRIELIGDKDTEGTLEYFKHEKEYLENSMASEYTKYVSQRDAIVRKLHKDKAEILRVYESIYTPIQGEIKEILGDIEGNVSFKAELFMQNSEMPKKILSYIDQRMKGKFNKTKEGYRGIEKIINSTDFHDSESVLSFVRSIAEAVTEDLDQADRKIDDRQGFYDFLYCLEYIGVSFKLKMGDRNLNELSPGERGIVLLVFYLALNKESKPIIIDQPEDNLDNQSVYSKLVPCICKAKQKRQVIIVTHNPNIAIACDAEQIVFCEMDKNSCRIQYTAGSIENPDIKKHVVDVLEGTKPAFDLRSMKYN